MLVLENVTVRRGTFHLLLNLTVKAGARVAIIGPSGSGKSTMLDVVAGFQEVTGGCVIWAGRDLSDAPPAARPVSILFQDNNLFPHLSIAQNVGLGIAPDLKLAAAELRAVDEALRKVGLEGRGQDLPSSLSGGQQSRAALARVLVQSKPVVLLDEAFSALGPALRREMLELVMDVLEETKGTLLMVTHDPDEARQLGDQAVFVDSGNALGPMNAEEMFANPPEALRAYLGS